MHMSCVRFQIRASLQQIVGVTISDQFNSFPVPMRRRYCSRTLCGQCSPAQQSLCCLSGSAHGSCPPIPLLNQVSRRYIHPAFHVAACMITIPAQSIWQGRGGHDQLPGLDLCESSCISFEQPWSRLGRLLEHFIDCPVPSS
jgi:hypothetical protein